MDERDKLTEMGQDKESMEFTIQNGICCLLSEIEFSFSLFMFVYM